MEQQELGKEPLRVDEFTRRHLGELARWARFLGGAGLILTVSFAFVLVSSGSALIQNMYKTNPGLKSVEGGEKILAYIMLAFLLIPFFMSLHLFRSGNRLLLGLGHERQDYLNNALYNLKLVFRIFGIFIIVYLSFSILGFLAVLFTA
jgi:hypothetical protein